MKRYVRSASLTESIPSGFRKYYKAGTLKQAADLDYDTDYIGDTETVEWLKKEGYEWLGVALARNKYVEALDDGLNCLDLVKDMQTGETLIIEIAGGRIYPLDLDEVKRNCRGYE